jgi:hypothetical protein
MVAHMSDTLTFDISEDNYLGDAQFVVDVDGKPISGTLTTTASHGLGQSQTFNFFGDFSSAHHVAVTFLNDLYAGPGQDRDLYVDSFTFNGLTQLGTAAIANTGVISGTSANLIRTNDTATYDVSQYTDGRPGEHLTIEYRLFNHKAGDHLFTTSVEELNQVLKSSLDYQYEGVGWSTPDKGANTQDVFRFFNINTGDHFYTSSTAERDQVLKILPNLHYEGVAFQAYANASSTDPGLETVERFLNIKTGLHMYTADAVEIKAILSGQQGTGWIDEGKAFTVHVATDGLLHA